MASKVGLEALQGPRDIDAAKRALAAAGYNEEEVVLIAATDIPITQAQSQVTEQLLRQLGVNSGLRSSDWGTVVQRRASREPTERGGWSLFHTWFDHADPAGHLSIRGNGTGPGSWFGWPTSPTAGGAAQRLICRSQRGGTAEDLRRNANRRATRPTLCANWAVLHPLRLPPQCHGYPEGADAAVLERHQVLSGAAAGAGAVANTGIILPLTGEAEA